MDERVTEILATIGEAELAKVAAAALGREHVAASGASAPSEIVSPHGDVRTIGIVKLTGSASADGSAHPWSAIAKIIDFNVPPAASNTWVRPENEAAVYQQGCFTADGLSFRPARCYHVSHPEPAVTVLWLEDLTSARRAPFALDTLTQILRHLGEWNGVHAQRPPTLNLPVGRDSVLTRWREWDYDNDLAELRLTRDEPAIRALYGQHSIETAFALRDVLLKINAHAVTHTHTLCFGDCNIGNLFATPTETVAVDWASLTSDPLGVDAGSVIGSAITWGRDLVEIARNERELFESYMQGLAISGWRGNRDDVRRGHLLHFGSYLLSTALAPIFLKTFNRVRVEMRLETSWDDIPARVAGVVALLPSYLEELPRLLD